MVNLDQALGDRSVPFGHIGTTGHTPVAVNRQRCRTVAPVALIAIDFNSHLGTLWQAMRIKDFLDFYFDRQEGDNSSCDAGGPFFYQTHICGVIALIDREHPLADSESKASPRFVPYSIVLMASCRTI
ncbi:hypothetical protein PPG32_11415 [Lautropia mirabilis]|uniref:hypothetical protein n=1 Tax=Lautropia mirabilis TaxID=47671 RepID=UPI00234A2FD3|nr:hypothetical protein [Lautropia mirabilis]MDC6094705.1 hypothetical protein [Lautropia mirabilis]